MKNTFAKMWPSIGETCQPISPLCCNVSCTLQCLDITWADQIDLRLHSIPRHKRHWHPRHHVLSESSWCSFQPELWPANLIFAGWAAAYDIEQGWGACGSREHLIWPASEFSLPKLEHNIGSKRNSMTSRHVRWGKRNLSLLHIVFSPCFA